MRSREMASPSSQVKRRAWIRSSRHWPTLEELNPEEAPCNLASVSVADDDVFSDGCFTGKIENWLLGCGLETCSENSGQRNVEALFKASCSLDDDISLGADASALHSGDITSKVGHQELCLPSLNMGHSMTSSCLSASTCKTTSNVSEILQFCSEDAEETLYHLGFGSDEPQVTVRIPPRFFTFPSQAQGINFRLFLDSQIRRIREEDPSLSLASRFRQVQVLTAMANAFYSLYSHVSRTPLQKLDTPQFTFSSSPVERFERFRSTIRSEPRSPVDRLKDTVSKMCLYTGSPRGSDSTSPQCSPRRRCSLPDVVETVMKKVRADVSKRLDVEECNRSTSDVKFIRDGDNPSLIWEQQPQQTTVDINIPQNRNKICLEKVQDNKQTRYDDAGENRAELVDLDSLSHNVRTSPASLLGEALLETHHQSLPLLDVECCLNQNGTKSTALKPVAKVTYEIICPKITESVQHVPFCCQQTREPSRLSAIFSERQTSAERSCPRSERPQMQSQTVSSLSGADKDSSRSPANDIISSDSSRSLTVMLPDGGHAHYCITVTGSEKYEAFPCSLNSSTVQTCEESLSKGPFLNPLTHQDLRNTSLQQVNSFELEEVHSAGEEDFGKSEGINSTSLGPSNLKYKGTVVRGDSMQSDSSGYADEEVNPYSDTQSR
ncbi:protein ITPRID2 isoform X2 [Thalassophryne amazonica]|uniref:protein ITPRID2 isoform X2 n=1 Tax=Thalassophryne amazonica TaxID=390379 RepID=UPI0014722B52|nr:protein ITPRID2 isoform X2 [Thalassophryne amazonica]